MQKRNIQSPLLSFPAVLVHGAEHIPGISSGMFLSLRGVIQETQAWASSPRIVVQQVWGEL